MFDLELRRRLVPVDRRIFLSYAWLDEEVPRLDPEARGWVSYFYEQLRTALRHRLGAKIDFWRDMNGIDENGLIEQLIEEALQGSELLLAVVSPGYLESKWCYRERARFIKQCGDTSGHPIERVVKILKHHVDEAILPQDLQHRRGYRFFLVDADSGREIPFFFNGRLRREIEYLDVVERLVDYLVRCLQAIPQAQAIGDPTTLPTTGSAPTKIFLALPQGADASEPALRISAELRVGGFEVVQPSSDPVSELQARKVLEQVIAQATAAVHVVGRSAGALLRNGKVPATHLQLEVSGHQADRDSGFRRYILILATHEQGGSEHRAYVKRLQTDTVTGGLFRPSDKLVIERSGTMTIQEFIQIVRNGLAS